MGAAQSQAKTEGTLGEAVRQGKNGSTILLQDKSSSRLECLDGEPAAMGWKSTLGPEIVERKDNQENMGIMAARPTLRTNHGDSVEHGTRRGHVDPALCRATVHQD